MSGERNRTPTNKSKTRLKHQGKKEGQKTTVVTPKSENRRRTTSAPSKLERGKEYSSRLSNKKIGKKENKVGKQVQKGNRLHKMHR